MFTGIIEEIGTVRALNASGGGAVIEVSAGKVLEGTAVGDSIAVNGVCLTVASMRGGCFRADVMPESLRRTNLGSLRAGSRVNLERAMQLGGRFGGHIVSGHIDGTGRIVSLVREANAIWVTVEVRPELMRYIVEKGSVAIDGISLTVASVESGAAVGAGTRVGAGTFKVSIIPHTQDETTLVSKKPGDLVNIENDMVARYIERFVAGGEAGGASPYGSTASGAQTAPGTASTIGDPDKPASGGLTLEFLQKNGF